MNQKILIIIPYFGKMPNWFQAFLNSSAHTKLVDFLFITDDKTPFNYPSNFKVLYWDFKDAQRLFKKKLGSSIYLEHGYKFCDFKPTYGYVLDEYTRDYPFWGHSDIDLIWGDLDFFLAKASYTEFDRIFGFGHLSIYRNNDEINTAFRIKLKSPYPKIFDFDFVKRTSYPSYFDEIGMNFIMKEKGYRFFDEVFSHNVNMNFYNYAVGNGQPNKPELLLYDKGKLFIVRKEDSGHLVKTEFMYLHIMKRKIIENLTAKTDRFLITVDGFIDVAAEKVLGPFFERYGTNPDNERQQDYRRYLQSWMKNSRRAKLIREWKQYPLLFPFHIWRRKKGIEWVNQYHYR